MQLANIDSARTREKTLTPQAKINEVLARVSRLNLGSQVVLGNKTLTGNWWQKLGLTCHAKNQHKQRKQIEIRRWQSLHGSTLALVRGDFGQHEVQRRLFCQSTCQHENSAFKPFCSPTKCADGKRCTGWHHKMAAAHDAPTPNLVCYPN